MLTEEQKRRRRARSIAIALALGALVVAVLCRHARQGAGRPEPAVVSAARMTDAPTSQPADSCAARDLAVAAACGVFVAAMVGMAYAAVPLYNWFCRTTGFGGTTAGRERRARPACSTARSRCASTPMSRGGLPWSFEPEQTTIDVRIGEVVDGLLSRRPTNRRARPSGRRPTTSSPPTVGGLLRQDQLLLLHRAAAASRARQREMPVVFFVDPALVEGRRAGRPQHHHAVLHLLSGARAERAARPSSGRALTTPSREAANATRRATTL